MTARLHGVVARPVVVASLCMLVGCGDPPTPPSGVPSGATPVTFSTRTGWAYCWFDAETNVNRCRTYNWRGERLYRAAHEDDDDDVYLRYEGTGPVPQAELQIDGPRTEPDYVWLKNGVILLPRNAFDLYKAYVDKLMRVRDAEGRR